MMNEMSSIQDGELVIKNTNCIGYWSCYSESVSEQPFILMFNFFNLTNNHTPQI